MAFKGGWPEPAEVGVEFTVPGWGNVPAITLDVRESCGGKRGYWYCITHRMAFENQFQKDSHLLHHKPGKHVMCWMCLECGNAEVP